MAVAEVRNQSGNQLWNAFLDYTGIKNVARAKRRISIQTGVADGGATITKTSLLKGDLVYDLDNTDWYICTVDATTVKPLQ
jgi:hypothetical protein